MAVPFLWQRNLLHALRTHSVLVLHGNIRDVYMCPTASAVRQVRFDELIARLLSPDFTPVRCYDPYSKASELLIGEADAFVQKELEGFGSPGFTNTIEPTLARVLAELESGSSRRHTCWLLKDMHDVLPFRGSYPPEEGMRLIACQRMVERMHRANRLILGYLSETDVPLELSRNAHRVAFLKVPMPDYPERLAFWMQAFPEECRDLAKSLARLTDGLALTSLETLLQLASDRAQAPPHQLSLGQWGKILASFKFGETENPYDQLSIERLDEAKEYFTEGEGIKGQDYAVNKTISLLWKAKTNISAVLRGGSSTPPRIILFACGPSGVGKTLLMKTLAKFVFEPGTGRDTAGVGDPQRFVRIDMSEYGESHAVARLIGSPPGYVGHEEGGVLTNIVRERPFCLVLFDEIEKAHPRFFDILLQLLSDGRLTDGHGQTVFFSEAMVAFTSNVGTRPGEQERLEEARQSGDPERVRDHFIKAVSSFFRHEIGRPEILNRIGKYNIVPFDYLQTDDVLRAMVTHYLRGLRTRFDDEYAPRNLRLRIEEDGVIRFILDRHAAEIREFGGRAVLNVLEEVLLPDLAKMVLTHEAAREAGPKTLTVCFDGSRGQLAVRI